MLGLLREAIKVKTEDKLLFIFFFSTSETGGTGLPAAGAGGQEWEEAGQSGGDSQADHSQGRAGEAGQAIQGRHTGRHTGEDRLSQDSHTATGPGHMLTHLGLFQYLCDEKINISQSLKKDL